MGRRRAGRIPPLSAARKPKSVDQTVASDNTFSHIHAQTTSLVSYIGLQELTLVTLQIYAHNFKVVESLVAAGIFYLAMTTVLSLIWPFRST